MSLFDKSKENRLFAREQGAAHAWPSALPKLLVISGGRPGVGATSLAVQLSAALAQDALRTVLIDADLYRADVAAHCHLTAGIGIGDVLAARQNIHEALQLGPGGMQVLIGTTATETRNHLSERAIHRLLKQMCSLAPHADWLVVDAGNQPSELAARMWSIADHLLLVTSPDAVAVMDTYALIKTLLKQQSLREPPALLVNQAVDETAAADVHRRIDQSCRRFLGLAIEFAGWLPLDPQTRAIVFAATTLAPAVIALAHKLHQRHAISDTRKAAA